jgi:hypothetical protein
MSGRPSRSADTGPLCYVFITITVRNLTSAFEFPLVKLSGEVSLDAGRRNRRIAYLVDHQTFESVIDWIHMTKPSQPRLHIGYGNNKTSVDDRKHDEHTDWYHASFKRSVHRSVAPEEHGHSHLTHESDEPVGKECSRCPSQVRHEIKE